MSDSAMTLPGIIRILGRGKTGSRDLTFEEAHFAMSAILDNRMDDLQLGAFLMLLRVKEETPNEIAGMVKACHEHMSTHPPYKVDVCWPAYAGKKRQPSWYLLAAKLLAKNNVSILMHGGGQHTANRQYAQQVCEFLQMPTAESLESAVSNIENQGFCYLPLEAININLSRLIDLKHNLGLRSCANTLVRHLTPFDSKLTVQGMFHPAYQILHHEVADKLLQKNNIVLKGDAGEFEVRPDSDCKVLFQGFNPINSDTLAKTMNQRAVRPSEPNLEPLISLWLGTEPNAYGQQAVIETAALIIAKLREITLNEARSIVLQWWKDRSS
ncbi:glycosyl transferase family protein [Reinekea forsetii]|nr:glycosyl transferase family protein [Reinekea forsetii]